MNIKLKKIDSTAIIPTKGTRYSAGNDLYSTDTVELLPHSSAKIHTGIAIQIPQNCFGAIFARSGLATKEGLRPANCVGVIDSDYRGEIQVILHNDSDMPRMIRKGERIAQLVIIPFKKAKFKLVENLDSTERGIRGFGSSGRF